ncbi:MAG: chromosomal replication initiator protein DnaA [Bacteroidaceae bacterium]|nr:chromosomal replication initiator protein DnaA [Bacteroidaceae bacterium]MBQ7142234.1 chromosomal replication initiator protein DnaA [Bacteroidaceae bacterium]
MVETEQNPKLLWGKCLDIIRDNITPEQFAASFAFVELHSFEDGKLILDVPSEFVKRLLEENFLPLMASTFKRVFGNSIHKLYYNVKVVNTKRGGEVREMANMSQKVTNGPSRKDVRKSPGDVTAPQVQDLDSQLIADYRFDNYIEGESNRLARSVGESIANNPAKTFNPFFVYGPSGCGKTHLINAIGLSIKEQHPQMRVLYLSAHLFTVQYTDAVRQNKVNEFIRFYQTIDTLILDDVQELSGKGATQNTFFHIFNHLQRNNKQIILSADRPPIAIQDLEDRLLTRFKWGMQAEIEKPTQNLRLNILSAKVEKEGLNIPANVLKFISENIDDSVRDLEGVINSLMAYSVVYNCDINMALVRKIMPRFVEKQSKELTIDDVKQSVCDHFNLKVNQLDSRTRTQQVAYARQVAMYLAAQLTDKSHVQIGVHIGNRNHATVIHALKQIKDMMEVDEKVRQDVEELMDTLHVSH